MESTSQNELFNNDLWFGNKTQLRNCIRDTVPMRWCSVVSKHYMPDHKGARGHFYLSIYKADIPEFKLEFWESILTPDEWWWFNAHGHLIIAHAERLRIRDRKFTFKTVDCIDSVKRFEPVIIDRFIKSYTSCFKTHKMNYQISRFNHDELFKELQQYIHHPVRFEKILLKYGFDYFDEVY